MLAASKERGVMRVVVVYEATLARRSGDACMEKKGAHATLLTAWGFLEDKEC